MTKHHLPKAATTHPKSPADVDALAHFIGRIFSNGRYDELVRKLRTDFHDDPNAKPEYFRTIVKGGKPVAQVAIYEKLLRIGKARFRTGGIGFVACDPAERKHGYAARCMTDSLDVMRKNGMPLALLTGIDRYYTRFGFIGCYPKSVMRVAVADLADVSSPLKVTDYKPADLPELVRLYEAATSHIPGTVVRTAGQFRYAFKRQALVGKGSSAIRVFRTPGRNPQVRAYLVWRDGAPLEAALAPGDTEAAAAVLAFIRDGRKKAGEKEVVFGGFPAGHPIFDLVRTVNHGFDTGMHWTGGWMGVVLDVPEFLGRMVPELEARWTAAQPGRRVEVNFSIEKANYVFALGSGPSADKLHVGLTRQALLLLSLGTLPAGSVPGVFGRRDPRIMNALFPVQSPGIYRLDYF